MLLRIMNLVVMQFCDIDGSGCEHGASLSTNNTNICPAGSIELKEMTEIIGTLYQMEGVAKVRIQHK